MAFYDDVYAALEAADVRYVVVGGMAVVLSGHVRATVDLDVVIDLDREPALRAVQALSGLGLLPRVPVLPEDLADEAIRQRWITDKHMQVLSFFDPQNVAREIDVFMAHPLDFEAMVARAVWTRVGERVVPVAAPDDLIAMKTQAGRPQDVADIEALRRIQAGGLSVTSNPTDVDRWERASFDGTATAQAAEIAALTPDARVALLEELLAIALASGALQNARAEKQRMLDVLWAS